MFDNFHDVGDVYYIKKRKKLLLSLLSAFSIYFLQCEAE
jgi:hypothetical protein